ncbi:colorectal mutant cancer protein [Tachysurus fulvidraco]|uniref:colorectal mutant cancer protein n=1 Tax=Tachysurus fulvidraco TaxID=1234273 RepID=UPI001FEEDC78|nr:colorectal mutant cancer protein [Tachysurus fulvidraco]
MTEKTDSLACAESELAQCEAEVGTLLQIISELNVKMSALKISRDPRDYETQTQACDPVSELKPSPLVPQSSPVAHRGTASVQYSEKYEECSAELWTKLQEVLFTLESSAVRGRKLVAPYVHDDQKAQEEHISAARNTWVHATQILVEMERELGISYPSALPTKERQNYQKEVLSLSKLNRKLSSSLQKCQEEQKKMEETILEIEEEKKRLREKLDELKNKWLITASCSPPRSPSLSFSRTPSPRWASPPSPSPASPLISRRMPISPLGSPSRPPRPSSGNSVLETETEHLQRSLERLKSRNERLTAALERRKSESEQISMALSRHEADCSALHMALTYCEECEEAYSELMCLHEGRKGQNAVLAEQEQTAPEQTANLNTANEESSCTTVSTQNSLSSEEFEEKTRVIQQRIGRLKQDRAAVCIPQETRTGEGKLSPDTGTLAGARRLSYLSSNNPKEEKTALLHELVNAREEMSELRELIRLKEKERCSLEFTFVAHRCHGSAGAALAQSLREELEERSADQQRIEEYRAKLECGELNPGPRNHAIMRELQAVIQREQTLKRRVTSLRELLDTEMLECTTQRRVNKEEVARLLFFHNKAMSACKNARKKHHEQLWRIERQMTAMQERHESQLTELKTTLEALKWKKEETVL